MLTLREFKPRIFEVTLSDVVDKSDIATMKRELKPALEANGKMGIILHLEALDDVICDALIADARFEFSILPQWSKVARVAEVTDKQAFQALLNWFDSILPTIDVPTFAPSEKDAADNWASEGFDLGLLGDKDTLTSKLGTIGTIGRYAVVGASGWMRAMIRSMGPLIPIEMCAFDASEDDAARQWACGV
ncbi:STAS/SEC14 domain-containing protein [Roseovarius sp. S1116L3]|uniref:STAS/SEC14 domain-containing protein n=1 Tax=Roseovarius roseus TaxID=3342636 RepID=UPI0037270EB3